MQLKVINLKDEYSNFLPNDVYLTCVTYDLLEMNHKRLGILILPGGGYNFTSAREKDPIMFKMLSFGFNVFALEYSCKTTYPIPHIEVACAMHYINTHHEEFNLEEYKTSLMGFSAGGHLAASYGYIYKTLADSHEEEILIRPYSIVLGYPVISLSKSPLLDTRKNITDNKPDLIKLLDVDEHISFDYPPTFMFTTKTDQVVDPKNVKWMKDALNKKKVKNKCIIFSKGPHGLALANYASYNGNPQFVNEEVSAWPKYASDFIYKLKEK